MFFENAHVSIPQMLLTLYSGAPVLPYISVMGIIYYISLIFHTRVPYNVHAGTGHRRTLLGVKNDGYRAFWTLLQRIYVYTRVNLQSNFNVCLFALTARTPIYNNRSNINFLSRYFAIWRADTCFEYF